MIIGDKEGFENGVRSILALGLGNAAHLQSLSELPNYQISELVSSRDLRLGHDLYGPRGPVKTMT